MGNMKPRHWTMLIALIAIAWYRILNHPSLSTILYLSIERIFQFDKNIKQIINYHGEIEDEVLTHKFIPLTHTSAGDPVDVTYHVVECGPEDGEVIVFFHGLCETWRIWKYQMLPYCSTHRVIAIDSEGMGQSWWPNPEADIPEGASREFMGQMTIALLDKMDVNRFNMVVTDYSFWSTMYVVTHESHRGGRILRYAKFQSTVGVEDNKRVPQAIALINFSEITHWMLTGAPHAMARVLYSQPNLNFPGLKIAGRVAVPIEKEIFEDIILSGISPDPYKAWMLFYKRGLTLIQQMFIQIPTFQNMEVPVLMVQGKEDAGQPYRLFDGSAVYGDPIYSPIKDGILHIKDRYTRFNDSHLVNCTYSDDHSIIGPTALDFVPRAPWKKFVMMEGVGHFPHIEAKDDVKELLRELFNQPILE
jgi:pimeloyl-ACP methyl ester carboxylesterase